jgi:flap endonuclease-1
MGIKQLMHLINEKAPAAVRKMPIERYSGQIVVCDASMAIYQFIAATQWSSNSNIMQLTDSEGNQTAHLVGLLNRSLILLEHHIKPVWVFDGNPPDLKKGELSRRKQQKEEAKAKVEEAQEEGKTEEVEKQMKRNLRVTKEMTEDAKTLIRLLGLPIVEAPGEAEAECACLVKTGKANAVASEDMDSLAFGANYLLRGLNSKKEPIVEITLAEVLTGLELSQDQFIDLCILLGSDYTEHIEGVGPATAFNLMKAHASLEKVLENIQDLKKYRVPESFNWEGAKDLFIHPDVNTDLEFSWGNCDETGLVEFLVQRKGFSQKRVEDAIEKMKKCQGKKAQMVLESFFGKAVVTKRKPVEPTKGKKGKKKK